MLQGESEEERGGSEEVKQNGGREDTDAGKMTDRAVLEETGGRKGERRRVEKREIKRDEMRRNKRDRMKEETDGTTKRASRD